MEARLDMPDLAALLAEIQALPEVLRTRVTKGAVATGASVVRKAAIEEAPQWTGPVAEGHPPPGTLKKSIYQTRLVEQCSAALEVWKVDVRRGSRTVTTGPKGARVKVQTNDRDAFYAYFVEYGHYVRTPKMTSKQHRAARAGVDIYTGSKWIPPNPFMRRAWEGNKDAALKAMADYIVEQLPIATATNRLVRFKP